MGRPRKHNPTIPEHIDQTKLPAGIYWDQTGNGRWYVLEDHPEGGTNKKTVAGRKARLSELHDIVEQRSGGEVRGTIAYVIKQFRESTEYAALSANTRKDYDYCAAVAEEYITKSGQPLTDMHVDRLSTPAMQKVTKRLRGGERRADHVREMRFRVVPRKPLICCVFYAGCSTGVGDTVTARQIPPIV